MVIALLTVVGMMRKMDNDDTAILVISSFVFLE